jgi:hypothetical protein
LQPVKYQFIDCQRFFISFAGAANVSELMLNFRIFAAQISVRQNCHCRNLDAERIDFIKRYGSVGKLILVANSFSPVGAAA